MRATPVPSKEIMRALVMTIGVGLATAAVDSATPIEVLRYSSDIGLNLGAVTLSDEEVASDDLGGTIGVIGLGSLPAEVDLDAYHQLNGGDHLFSVDTKATIGGVTVSASDVLRYNGTVYVIEFAGAGEGVPSGARVDAVSAIDDTDLLLSFDVTVSLGGVTVRDEDLVRFDGGTFSILFDGSAAGVDAGLDLDAAHYVDCNGHLLLSFDGAGTVGGVVFDDDDVLDYDASSGNWELIYDGAAEHMAWRPADLDALHATAVDMDGDGSCAPADCDDMVATCGADCATDADADTIADCADTCLDSDGDNFGDGGGGGNTCEGSDCDDADPNTFPGAAESNDGMDNQCPGDVGYGVADEVTGGVVYADPMQPNVVCWAAQSGANLYQIGRSDSPQFPPGCVGTVTASTCWTDPETPESDHVFYYLVRVLTPNTGSWGQDSTNAERIGICQ